MNIKPILFTTVLVCAMLTVDAPVASAQGSGNKTLPHFLFPEFREGVVIMKADKPFSTRLNYNMLEQRMVTEFNGAYRYSKDPALIDSVLIENRVFAPVDGKFYEVISRGRFTFMVQHRATLIVAGNDVGYGVKSQSTGPTQYKRFEMNSYWGDVAYLEIPAEGEVKVAPVFWVSQGTVPEKFSNARQLMKIMPGYEPVIREYMEKEEVNFKSAEDLAKLGDYLNKFAGEN
ncbi:MAG: hypothetical protein WAV93_02875 [Bacteroidales bacterium]